MCIILIRSLILYILVISAVRLMGKRQLGELQPSELVITILVSNIATLPLEDTAIPLIVGITPILSLVCFEVIVSWLDLHLPALRKLISGSPKIIISEGTIDSAVMRELRLSADDLMTAVRGSGIFDLSEVQFAIVETTGSISVMKKPVCDIPVRKDLLVPADNTDPPQIVISDRKILQPALAQLGISSGDITGILEKHSLSPEDVFLMTADRSGKYFISLRSGKGSLTGGGI